MAADHRPGEKGVSTLCPVCPGWTIWTEDLQRFICFRPECPGNANPGLVADEIHLRGQARRGGYGRGHEAVRNGDRSLNAAPRLRFVSALDLCAEAPLEPPWVWGD